MWFSTICLLVFILINNNHHAAFICILSKKMFLKTREHLLYNMDLEYVYHMFTYTHEYILILHSIP